MNKWIFLYFQSLLPLYFKLNQVNCVITTAFHPKLFVEDRKKLEFKEAYFHKVNLGKMFKEFSRINTKHQT